MFDLYQEKIVSRAKHPEWRGIVAHATHSADGENRSCGDEVHIELQVDNETITQMRHQVRACTICAAAADMLCEELEGKSLSEVKKWNSEKIQTLLGIPLSPVRLKCALLPLETIRNALSLEEA